MQFLNRMQTRERMTAFFPIKGRRARFLYCNFRADGNGMVQSRLPCFLNGVPETCHTTPSLSAEHQNAKARLHTLHASAKFNRTSGLSSSHARDLASKI
eukprot:892461-Amphidinium_carterae.1